MDADLMCAASFGCAVDNGGIGLGIIYKPSKNCHGVFLCGVGWGSWRGGLGWVAVVVVVMSCIIVVIVVVCLVALFLFCFTSRIDNRIGKLLNIVKCVIIINIELWGLHNAQIHIGI